MELLAKNPPLTELIAQLDAYMVKLGYTSSTLRHHRQAWNALKNLALAEGKTYFTKELGFKLLKEHYHVEPYETNLSEYKSMVCRSVMLLLEFQISGTIAKRTPKSEYIFPEGFRTAGETYLSMFDRVGSSGSNGALGNMVQPVLDVGGVLNGLGTDFAFPGMLDTRDSGSLQVKYEAYYTNPGFVWVDNHCQRIVNEATTDAAERTSTWIKADNNTVYMLFTEDIMALSERSVLNYGGYACYEDDIGNELFAKLAEEGKQADSVNSFSQNNFTIGS